jgi:hypothetical protein
VVELRAELLDDLGERVAMRLPLLDREPPPGGVDMEERVGDVLAGHQLQAIAPGRVGWAL